MRQHAHPEQSPAPYKRRAAQGLYGLKFGYDNIRFLKVSQGVI